MFNTSDSPTVIYDGECPFCANYVTYYRLKQSLGNLRLVDARSLSPEDMRRLGSFDLDEGMLFILDGKIYHGADAVHALALMTSGAGFFNKLNAFIFRRKWLATLLYPALRLGRAVALKAKGAGWIKDTVSR